MKFEPVLKNTKLKSYHVMGWIIASVSVITQIIMGFTLSLPEFISNKLLPFIGVITTLVAYLQYRYKVYLASDYDQKDTIITTMVWAAIVWTIWHFYWLAGITVVFLLLYIVSTRKFRVRFTKKSISYPSFPPKHITWSELQNVILKDGILTIDFKDNKLIQMETEEVSFYEQEFNEFCREQLLK